MHPLCSSFAVRPPSLLLAVQDLFSVPAAFQTVLLWDVPYVKYMAVPYVR